MTGTGIRFLGAADTVTGSRYLLEANGKRILVDCGLFQGFKVLRNRNRLEFPVPPASIDAVLLTHAHLDHSGYLPALVRDGFAGPIYASAGTAELCGVILPDSGHLLEEEAEFAGRHGFSRHERPTPLYTVEDALACLEAFTRVHFDQPLDLGGGITATFVRAGHIVGASQVRVDLDGTMVHFSGDLGREHDPLMVPPAPLERTDVLVVESTYGDRVHPKTDAEAELGAVVARVAARGGVVVIPAFAVGRAESLLLLLARLQRKGTIPEIPVFLNSPMAINASAIYRAHRDEHRLDAREFDEMYALPTLVRSADESKLLNLRGGPMVIISASGMLEGGRVLHHVVAYGDDPKNAIVLAGFQAGGTRGAALMRGERSLRIFGRDVPIRAEVLQLESLSAHADADEVLAWMRAQPVAPAMTFVTHGEPTAADTLRTRIDRELGWEARVPENLETVPLPIASRHRRAHRPAG